MFKTRLLSGILLVLIALATIIPGGLILGAVLFCISLKGMHELYQIADVQNKLLGIVGMIAATVYYGFLFFGNGTEDWFAMTGDGCLFWTILCNGDVVLCIPYKNVRAGCIPCMARVLVFLGERYVCLLCRNADWKA